jgi:hypothetical protein
MKSATLLAIAFTISSVCGGALLGVSPWLITEVTSPAPALYRANKAAAEEFIESVEVHWPHNPSAILPHLRKMEDAYRETGDADPVKLSQIERLYVWARQARTVADQQRYLAEVRSSGKVTPKRPWYMKYESALEFALYGALLGFCFIGRVARRNTERRRGARFVPPS